MISIKIIKRKMAAASAGVQHCAACEKSVNTKNVDYLMCINCGTKYHYGCTSISNGEFKLIIRSKNITFTCDECLANIHAKAHDIQLIKQQLENLTKLVQVNTHKIDKIDFRQLINGNPKKDKSSSSGDNTKKSPKKKITPVPPTTLVSDGVSYTGAVKGTKHPEDATKDGEPFVLVRPKVKKRTKTKPIFGSRPPPTSEAPGTSGQGGLRAIDRKAHIYVGRLHPDTTVDEVQSNLVDVIAVNSCSVAKITSKSDSPTYASFHLICDYSDIENVKNPEIWPQGTVINRYFKPFQRGNPPPPPT